MRHVQLSFKICLLAGVLLVTDYLPARAQMAEDLKRLEKQVEEQKAVTQSLEKKEKATSQELESLRRKLISATKELQTKQSEQEELEEKLGVLEKETALRAGVLGESHRRLASLTSALLELGRQPPELFVLHEAGTDEHIHRTILLKSLLPRLKEETLVIAQEIENFESLQNQTSAQKRMLKTAQQNLQWQRHNLDQLVQARQGYLEKTAEEKQALAKQLESLSNEAKDLRQLMEKVSNPSWGRSVGKADVGKALPSLKSSFKKPVLGKIIRAYGDKDDFGVASEGVTFLASSGSPIVAPQTGRVVFAGPFKGYGRIVILQHNGGFHSFLSGFSRIDAETGQTIEAGEPLGVLPAKGEGKPELYFEWRKGSDPVDPTTGGMDKKG